MIEPVDHLAELTRHRDRELLDTTLAGALRDLLRPQSLAIYRKVGERDNERWLTRARIRRNDVLATGDPPWTTLNTLPRLQEHPQRHAALAGNPVVSEHAGLHVSVFPLATDREIVGVLEVESEAALDLQAHHLVTNMLRVYCNFESLLDYSERDMLTGLLNRKTFDESFLKIARTSAADAPYWVGMLDIDRFKSINDRYGHLIGDEVLLLQSRLMRGSLRFHDHLYRFGGEEFVVLVRCPNAADAATIFERVRRNTAGHVFPQVGHITVSIGYTQISPDDSPSAALGRADAAVYYAKTHGRDQVHSHTELVARGEIAPAAVPVGEVDLF